MATDLLPFDVKYVPIAVDFINGTPLDILAEKYDWPPQRITEILDLPEIKRFIDHQIQNIGYNSALKRARLIEEMIDSKSGECLEAGVMSRKDLAELLKLAQDEAKLQQPKGSSTNIQVNQQNNYTDFIKDILDVSPSKE